MINCKMNENDRSRAQPTKVQSLIVKTNIICSQIKSVFMGFNFIAEISPIVCILWLT